jgi:long-chain acyl-CoA synthetase
MNAFDYFFEHSKESEKEFILGSRERVNFRILFNQSSKLATYIETLTDKEEKILLISPNNVFFVTVYLAILKSGRICVPLNPDIEAANLDYISDQCNSKYVFIHPKYIGKHNTRQLNVISDLNFPYPGPLHFFRADKSFDNTRCAEIIFTSGSTGKPKGVMISHKNIIANTNSIIKYLQLKSEDIVEVVMPFYYCYGLSLLHTHLRVGGSIVLNNTFVFLGSVLNDLQNYRCTGFAGVPSHFQILLRKSESFKRTNFPYLRYVTQAGGKLHDVFIQEFIESHPAINFFVMYGQTEATARLSYLPVEQLQDKLGSIGKGIPGVELKVVNQSGIPIKPGEIGEIIASGENIMHGYLNDPDLTAETIRSGWLYTGDLATVDEEGFIFIKARQKEIIKVGGKRISPKEIEEVIVSIPEVIDCTIFSVEDQLLGEAIKAKITIDKANQEKVTAEYIKHHCTEKLSPYKIPQIIEVIDSINMSSTGKKIKGELN